MDPYQRIARPLLFRFDPETAHRLARPALQWRSLSRQLGGGPPSDPRLRVQAGPLQLPGPVGLAPGFDKHAQMVVGLGELGFGLLTLGTVLPEPRRGNPRPRIVRRPSDGSMVNALGLPTYGLEPFARRLERSRSAVPIIASIGALHEDGYLQLFRRLQPLVAGIEINLRCNNNRDDRGDFLHPDAFERLMRRLLPYKQLPVYVKINDWQTEDEHRDRMEVVVRGLALGVDGFSPISVMREPDPGLAIGIGNLTGRPLFEGTLAVVREIHDITRGRAVIRPRGGVSTGTDAFRLLQAGATTVELLTAFIYRGWAVARKINEELLAEMEAHGVRDLRELAPADRGLAA